jgi:hypothetical protein
VEFQFTSHAGQHNKGTNFYFKEQAINFERLALARD